MLIMKGREGPGAPGIIIITVCDAYSGDFCGVYIAVGNLDIFGLSDSKMLLSHNHKQLVKSTMPCPNDDNMNSLSE